MSLTLYPFSVKTLSFFGHLLQINESVDGQSFQHILFLNPESADANGGSLLALSKDYVSALENTSYHLAGWDEHASNYAQKGGIPFLPGINEPDLGSRFHLKPLFPWEGDLISDGQLLKNNPQTFDGLFHIFTVGNNALVFCLQTREQYAKLFNWDGREKLELHLSQGLKNLNFYFYYLSEELFEALLDNEA